MEQEEGVSVESSVAKLVFPDGTELAYRAWEAESPQGVVVGVHGIRSHAGWYARSGAYYAERGYSVYFPDRRGSGLNREATGKLSARRLVEDLVFFVGWVRDRCPGLAVHLEAISWGGKLSVAALLEKPELADTLILMAPGGIASRRGLPAGAKLRVLVGHVLGRDWRMEIPLEEPELFTANQERLAFLRRDTLSLREAPVELLWTSHVLDRRIAGAAPRLSLPVFLMLAEADPICDNDGILRFYDQLGSNVKQVKVYQGAGHTLEFEPDPEPIFADVVKWLGRFGSALGGER